MKIFLAGRSDTLALWHLVWSQDFRNCVSPSSKWCLPLRSSGKNLEISKGQIALERQQNQRCESSGFTVRGSVAARRVLSPPGALALGGVTAVWSKWHVPEAHATADINTSFPQAQRCDGDHLPPKAEACSLPQPYGSGSFKNFAQFAKILLQSKGS